MKLIQKILIKLKYLVLIINYKLFNSKTDDGYANLVLNKSIIKKTIAFSRLKPIKKYNINYQRTERFLEFIKKKKLKTIVDFGGGAGYHYFIAKKKLPNFNFKWLVIENKTMVKLCNKKLIYKNLFFYNSINKIKKIDVFFSSCAINYLNNADEILKKISNKKFKYIYFTRTPLSEDISVSFKQYSLLSNNGPAKIKREKDEIVCTENYILSKTIFESFFKQNFMLTKKYIDEKQAFYARGKYYDTYTYIFKSRS